MRRLAVVVGLAAVSLLVAPALPAAAVDCSRTSVGLTALPDLGTGTYKGETGGLYPGGTNEPPAAYADAGLRASRSIVPRDAQGRPDPNGKSVLLSVGMSNATQEFSAFVAMARGDAKRDPHVVVVDGAQGGQDATRWMAPSAQTWSVVDDRLRQNGVTAAQVQAIWLKEALAGPRGDFASSAAELARDLATIVRTAADRYPHLQHVFLSPRTYAGYATTSLNPEPYAYESGFAVRRVVADSIAHPETRPWVGWGPYLWTDGGNGRSDGVVWTCDDVVQDGTHPSRTGQQKVAMLLQSFFDDSRFTSWYRPTAAQPAPTPSRAAASSSEPAPIKDVPDFPALPIGLALLAVAAGITWFALRR